MAVISLLHKFSSLIWASPTLIPFYSCKNKTLTELASASLNRGWWELSLFCQTAPAHILNLWFCLSSHTSYFLFFPLQFMYLSINIHPDFCLFFAELIYVPHLRYISVNLCGSECIFLVLSHCLGLQIPYPWLGLITRIMWRSTYNQIPPQSVNNLPQFS